jgi:molybdopterin converting factor small subunit
VALHRSQSTGDLFGDLLNGRTMPTVNIASPLRSYTKGASTVSVEGATVAEVLVDLEHRYPGMRFRMIDEQSRIRQHIRIFVNTEGVSELSTRVASGDVVHLICALSGG